MTPGHLFVVNGRLGTLSADAVVIPTDAWFTVGHWWRGAAGLGREDTWDDLRPEGWTRGAALPARGKSAGESVPAVWFLDVVEGSPSAVGGAARQAVEAIVERSGESLVRAANAAGRHLPLIAMPVVGTGAGGLGRLRGRVIAALVASLRDAAERLGVDIVLVAAERSDYAALQHRRREAGTSVPPAIVETATELGERIRNAEVALFFGAGVSIAAGLPSWSELLAELVQELGLEELEDKIEKLGPLEQAELVQVTLARTRRAEPVGAEAELGRHVAAIIADGAARPSLAHALLASLHVREAVTTNYDRLYERAVAAAHGTEGESAVDVLPWSRTSSERPWLLKMHGDVEHPESIVLSRSSFVHYDSRWKPVGSLVQSLMLTKHLLVVGASMRDDNLIRFAYEVAGLREAIETTDRGGHEIGTVVSLAVDDAFSRLWEGRFSVVVPQVGGDVDAQDASTLAEQSAKDREHGEASERRQAARALAVFLDTVAMHAVRESPFLLDRRYADGRREETAQLVEEVNEVANRARAFVSDDAWRQLVIALDQFGARDH